LVSDNWGGGDLGGDIIRILDDAGGAGSGRETFFDSAKG
tara:strand:+ start:294 stop:410 length:117 start_codon:yes stop_codon:yes gene_type:complete